MSPSAKPKIAFVIDDRLTRERLQLTLRVANALRSIGQVEMITGGVTEDELLRKLEAQQPQLVLAPWYRYLAWSKVEALYGLTRTSGPTFAGYLSDQIQPYELGEQADHMRAILIDFNSVTHHEALALVRSLLLEQKRSGIRSLVEASTPVYCEAWYGGQGLGFKMDSLLSIPELANGEWARRMSSIRICLGALWSLVYEEGPGKGEWLQAQASATKNPRGYFQLAADTRCLVLRLCYTLPGVSPKDLLSSYWPGTTQPTSPAHLLERYADFVRVHPISETQDIEVVAGFVPSAPAESAPAHIHTLWVEPITPKLVLETPFEAPHPSKPWLRLFPSQAPMPADRTEPAPGSKKKEGTLRDAAVLIRDLKMAVTEKDDMIQELRSGGVGTSQPLPPPDAEGLIEAFNDRVQEAEFQIRQLSIEIDRLEEGGATQAEVENVRQRIAALAALEQGWIKKLVSTLELYKKGARNTG